MQERDKYNNLIEQLLDAWAFESRLLELVEEQARTCQDSQSRRLYREHARTTRTQIGRIDQRWKALGCQATGRGGWFTARLNRLASEVAEMDVWRDESTQLLITSYGIKQVECGMPHSFEPG
jgi:ferritin-like metal-binding protein YciE